MASKDEGIKRLGKDLYQIRWESAPKPDGKRGQMSRTVAGTREEAKRQRAAEVARSRGCYRGITYQELWDAVTEPSFALDNLKARTVEGYERSWHAELKKHIAKKRVIDTTCRFVEDVLAQMPSPWTQKACHALWRKMVNQAIHEGLDMRNPVDRYIRRGRAEAAPRAVLESRDVRRWVNRLGSFPHRAVLYALAGGGLRVEEAMALTVADISRTEHRGRVYAVASIHRTLVQGSHGRILQDTTKNRFSARTIWIGEPFATALLDALPETGPICPSRILWGGGELHERHFLAPSSLTNSYRKWCASEGIDYVNPGKLRKSYSNWHAEAGSPDSAVSLSMGHSDGTTRGRNYQSLTRAMSIMLADNLTDHLEEEAAFAMAVG